MTVTAVTKKTTTAAVGEMWDLAVKVTPPPDIDPDTGSPVRFEVSRPDGAGTSSIVATPGDTPGVFTAHYVFDTEGEHTAVAVVPSSSADGGDPETRDGFTAAVEPQSEHAAVGAPETDDSTDDPAAGQGANAA